ncbi:MAG: arginine--tRNA ligase, partial [Lentisphaerae bacterium]|nr:arginine--tRNA ligase [Lentisphaerota bacterium]
MYSIELNLTKWMQASVRSTFPDYPELVDFVSVIRSTSPDFGDYQCNSAMSFAKVLKQKPRDIAEKIIAGLESGPVVARCEIAGPGFINIILADDWLAKQVERIADKDYLGKLPDKDAPLVVLDYSSPNFAKPMHIGHIRSTVIGNALDRIFRFLGFRVLADNHIGDWGTQCGVLIMGYRHFIDETALAESPVNELERVYVKSSEKSRQDPDWLDACRSELVKLQGGDPENLALWQKFVDLSMGEFERIYSRLDIKFDMTRGESYYHNMLAGLVAELEEKGLARESDGALVCFLEDEKLPPCIVRKSDGGFNYATTDIATIMNRVREFNPDKVVYVTDERQQLHFKQFFAIATKLGIETELQHVWFGLMRLPEGTFSTRDGNVIKLELLLDEAETRALELVRENSPEMSEEMMAKVAKAVGIGAIKYTDLSQNPQSLVTFSWEKALSMNGNSAPYLQYAHARIRSVADKYAELFPDMDIKSYPLILNAPEERALALRIAGFTDAVESAARMFKPNYLADYLYDLAGKYSVFYQNLPFLKAAEGTRESRMRLCAATAKTLRQGLNLLGIE